MRQGALLASRSSASAVGLDGVGPVERARGPLVHRPDEVGRPRLDAELGEGRVGARRAASALAGVGGPRSLDRAQRVAGGWDCRRSPALSSDGSRVLVRRQARRRSCRVVEPGLLGMESRSLPRTRPDRAPAGWRPWRAGAGSDEATLVSPFHIRCRASIAPSSPMKRHTGLASGAPDEQQGGERAQSPRQCRGRTLQVRMASPKVQ